MTDSLFAALAVTAASVGSLHSLAPDHWVPFAAVARAQGWSASRTARVTLACGFGHVTVSVLLGLLALLFGLTVFQAFGRRLESVAGVLMIAFGLGDGLWGLRRVAGDRLHGHSHAHYDHVHEAGRMTAWSLFLLFCADPCVAVIPILVAAAPLGVLKTAAVVVVYEAATIVAMLVLVLPARAGVRMVRGRWLDRYGDAAAGGIIAAVGFLVARLGW
jgi:hypothetical protein